MTYCLAISIDAGLVFASDSRTNAGVDNVSTYSKMHTFGRDGERQFVLLSSGNLATTQAVVSRIKEDIRDTTPGNLMTAKNMREASDYVGRVSREVQSKFEGGDPAYEATFIIGGQTKGQKSKARLIYAAGNHITTSADTPYLQIGESKYGKPILDRIMSPESSLETAALCALVSMDSTMRSNLSVGPPIDVVVYERDSLVLNRRYRFEDDSEYLRLIKKNWDISLKQAFKQLPPIAWGPTWDREADDLAEET